EFIAGFQKGQSCILAQEVDHIAPGASATTGPNGAGVAARVPEGETVGATTPGTTAVILLAIAARGGRAPNDNHISLVKGTSINAAGIDHGASSLRGLPSGMCRTSKTASSRRPPLSHQPGCE